MSDYLPIKSSTFSKAGRELRYSQLLTDEGKIDHHVVRAIARQSANQHAGHIVNEKWLASYRQHFQRIVSLAESMRDAKIARRAAAALPVEEQLRRSLEFELEKAKNGLGMPLDHDKIARLKAALEKARSAS